MIDRERVLTSALAPLHQIGRHPAQFVFAVLLSGLVIGIAIALAGMIIASAEPPPSAFGGRGGTTFHVFGTRTQVPMAIGLMAIGIVGVATVGLLSGWVQWYRADRPKLTVFQPHIGIVWAILYFLLVLVSVGVVALISGPLLLAVATMLSRGAGMVFGLILFLPLSLWGAYLGMRLTMAMAIQSVSRTRDFRAAWDGGHGHGFQAMGGQITLAIPLMLLAVFLSWPSNWLPNLLDVLLLLAQTWQGSGLALIGEVVSRLTGWLPAIVQVVLAVLASFVWLVIGIGVMVHALDDEANLPTDI